MTSEPVGTPRPTGVRECREETPGLGYWWDEVEQDYQDFDDLENPIGPVYTKIEWVKSGETCVPD